jgi:O-antigen/teichoic acid export membrane protein
MKVEKMQKNLILMALTMISHFLSTVAVFILLARVWKVDVYGEFMFLYVIVNILSVVIDYGYSLKMVKDLSRVRNKQERVKYYNEAFYSKVYILIGVTILFTISACVMDLKADAIISYIFLYCSFVFNSFAQFILLPFRVDGKMKIESIVTAIANLIFVIALLILVQFKSSAIEVTILFMVAKLVFLVSSIFVQIKSYNFDYKFYSYKHNDYLQQIALNFPYSVQLIVSVLYFQVDTLIIGLFLNNYDIGIYQSSMRIVSGLLVINAIFSNAYLPYISNLTQKQIVKINKKYTGLMFGLGVIVAGGQYLLADYLISFLYGEAYKEAIIILQMLSFMVLSRYIGVSYSVVLTVLDKQYLRAIAVCVALLLNVILNVILVPLFDLSGAVAASTITNVALLILYFMMTRAYLNREVDNY